MSALLPLAQRKRLSHTGTRHMTRAVRVESVAWCVLQPKILPTNRVNVLENAAKTLTASSSLEQTVCSMHMVDSGAALNSCLCEDAASFPLLSHSKRQLRKKWIWIAFCAVRTLAAGYKSSSGGTAPVQYEIVDVRNLRVRELQQQQPRG